MLKSALTPTLSRTLTPTLSRPRERGQASASRAQDGSTRGTRFRYASLELNRGLSLVEMLVSIVVGLVVVAGSLTLYTTSVTANANTIRYMRINQELRSVVDRIARDIRRAGYRGNAQACVGVGYTPYNSTCNNFGTVTITGGTQIAFSYDETATGTVGTLDSNEARGYRLSNGVVQTLTGGNTWENLTDANLVQVTALSFTPVTRAIDIDGAGTGTESVTVREIRVSIAGQLASDSSVTRQLIETARLRNDVFSL